MQAIYSRDRLNNISSNSSQMSVSPAPASSGSSSVAQVNSCSSRMKTAGNNCNNGSSGNVLRSCARDGCSSGNSFDSIRHHTPVSNVVANSGKQSTHSVRYVLLINSISFKPFLVKLNLIFSNYIFYYRRLLDRIFPLQQ